MKKITLKQLIFLFLCLIIAVTVHAVSFDAPIIESHQEAIFAEEGDDVNFKFEVIADGGAPIIDKHAYFTHKYDRKERLPDGQVKAIDDHTGKTYYYIILTNITTSDEGAYEIELFNKWKSGTAEAVLVVR